MRIKSKATIALTVTILVTTILALTYRHRTLAAASPVEVAADPSPLSTPVTLYAAADATTLSSQPSRSKAAAATIAPSTSPEATFRRRVPILPLMLYALRSGRH